VQVDALHQQRPARLRRRQRPRANGPWRSDQPRAALDQTGLDIVAAGQREQRLARERRCHVGEGMADQQRLLLQWRRMKTCGREAAEQRRGVRDIHGWNCRVCDHFAMTLQHPASSAWSGRLEDSQGNLIDELKEPVEFFFGGDDLLAKVEEVLADQTTGFETQLHLEPEHAFGEYDSSLVFFEERSIFPEGVEPGMQFDGMPEGAPRRPCRPTRSTR
jgi:hypothetical protein